ncbi:MAG TPA: hypothetical protein VKZ50_13605 [bacterium]|nr:hypothetical protein [bacterium]
MARQVSGIEAVREYVQKRIDRCTARIKVAGASAAGARRRTRSTTARAAPELAARRAYRDALRAFEDGVVTEAQRLASEEIGRVKTALERLYEVSLHPNHAIADAADWAIVEGESQAALNILREADLGAGGSRLGEGSSGPGRGAGGRTARA